MTAMNETCMTMDDLKWDVQQRLKLLESTLLLSGWVRTQALTDTFGISRAQASKDFAVYQALRPRNLVYNKSRKFYEAGEDFEPLLLTGKSSELLNVLATKHLQDGPVLAMAKRAPAVDMLRPLDRELDLRVFRAISAAASNGTKVRIGYQSMKQESLGPEIRTISPHTLVYSGFRWHVRAYSDESAGFRDYVLARIIGTVECLDEPGVPDEKDRDWHEQVPVRIGPHPGLLPHQRAIIEQDYGIVDGCIETQVRKSLVQYFLDLMLVSPGRTLDKATEQQICLLNLAELEPYLWKRRT
ncbi:MAG: WYL domain-containing protein [Halothiobacillaceae bacterium]|nr:MAG: WYL domain-containing protein [Halothiobacillaceae bacterium]